MPATTAFIAGDGPVISGRVWPFVCIVIMCGALSGFHSLIASGTTPKMLDRESDIRPIAYGAMVVEGFVAVTALVAACALEPGDYFAINVPQDKPTQRAVYVQMVQTAQTEHNWDLRPKELSELERQTGEKLVGRTGGAVTLAVGMAAVFARLMKGFTDYWYHFVIMFEALFILTLLETGNRVARFVVQESIAEFSPRTKVRGKSSWGMNILMSALSSCAWGYLLYTGNINTLWRALGISNQLLAAIALAVGTTYLLNHAPKRSYALCTGVPFVLVVITVLTAGVQSVWGWWRQIPSAPPSEQISLQLICWLTSIMLVLTCAIVLDAMRKWKSILATPAASAGPSAVTETA
jgi:carbon starvation protein